MPDRWLRLEKAAALLDVSPKTLRRWVQAGLFPKPIDAHGVIRWPERVVKAWKVALEFGFTLAREKTRQGQSGAANRDRKGQEGTN